MFFGKKKNIPMVQGAFSADRAVFKIAPTYNSFESEFYENLRAEVPVLDACFGKIVRLTNDFKLTCENQYAQSLLDEFSQNVPVGVSGNSLSTLADLYLDTLLTYGRALGTISIDHKKRVIKGICLTDPTIFKTECSKDMLRLKFRICNDDTFINLPPEEHYFYTTLNPSIKHPEGVSILRGLPALSKILMRIYECIGQNFDRVGNVRYAVTYKPSNDLSDKAFAKERALQIAREWSDGMNSANYGCVKDFVAVGDVDIKVIGADNQIIDTEIPVRQLLEQLISKLSIPPFLLGLNWSSTERMSSQQADILTSELEYYRRLLTPVLLKIGNAFLRLNGFDCKCRVEWANVNLQDEESLAKARLYNAQAENLENSQQGGCYE